MKLIGSAMSPYVRRLRLWLEGEDYAFVSLDIYSEVGRKALKGYTPTMKIPALVDDGQTLFDSRVIYRYLNAKLQRESLSWDDENRLTLIDAVNDSLVSLLLLKRSGLDSNQQLMFLDLQKERIANTLATLEQHVAEGQFDGWRYPEVCLFCLLDWADFRELLNLDDYPQLRAFHQRQLSRPVIQATDPRQA
ncbi:glutathione S-transferase family protein [Marinobacterium arenosum]|uniref:glutathione S-transferase family protein n=1 Tax=Marinobacterium arenosum TaxID=2862496 RepID=UPI001C95EFC2|nr:glutathione S-transferase family protein [Marinobacterium arenosum]MBY4677332.1 glutathione S-transferase family protein [Marinobacterium arenosum]